MSFHINSTKFFSTLVIVFAVFIALYLRWQTVPAVGKGRWLDTDVYRYVRQARIISETGGLPERDQMRWVPIGRDLSRQLSFSPYCLAWLYMGMQKIRPTFTLSDAALIYPLLCFMLSQVVFYFLIQRLFNRNTALLAVTLFALFPIEIYRSTAGFADRDTLTLLLGLSVFLCFVHALDVQTIKSLYIWAGLTGTAQMLLNATWEGNGLFSMVLAVFFVLKVLLGQAKGKHVVLYLGWTLPGLASLLFWTKTYYNLQPATLLAWGAPLLAGLTLLIFLVYQYLACKIKKIASFMQRFPSGIIALMSTFIFFIALLGIFELFTNSMSEVLIDLWNNIESPFGKSLLMRTISELGQPYTTDWVRLYGVSFIVISVGTLLVAGKAAYSWGINSWIGAVFWQIFVSGVVYSRFAPSSPLSGDTLSQYIFLGALLIFLGVLVLCAWYVGSKRDSQQLFIDSSSDKLVLALIWFGIMLLIARGGKRFHFFLTPIAVAFLSYALIWPIHYLWQKSQFMHAWRWAFTVVSFVCIGFFLVTFAHRSFGIIKNYRPTKPSLHKAILWMKGSLPQRSVVAAWWDYGSKINVLGNQATIIDEEQLHYWIHLMARHVFCAQSNEEALSFLKTHDASYLLISLRELISLDTISVIGSDEKLDRKTMAPVYFLTAEKPFSFSKGGNIIRLPAFRAIKGDFALSLPEPISEDSMLPANQWVIREAMLEFDSVQEGYVPLSASVSIQTYNGDKFTASPRQVYLDGKVVEQKDGTLPGILVCFSPPDEDNTSCWQAFYVSVNTAKLLSVRLLLLGEELPSFERVYPSGHSVQLPIVGIWKINYPSTILSKSEYLETEFPSSAHRRAWKRGYMQRAKSK